MTSHLQSGDQSALAWPAAPSSRVFVYRVTAGRPPHPGESASFDLPAHAVLSGSDLRAEIRPVVKPEAPRPAAHPDARTHGDRLDVYGRNLGALRAVMPGRENCVTLLVMLRPLSALQ